MGPTGDGIPGHRADQHAQVGRSEQTAIAITGESAYRNGFEIFVTASSGQMVMASTRIRTRHGEEHDSERQCLGITLQFSGGLMAISGRLPVDAEPTGPILRSLGGGGTSHCLLMRWRAWPLPPEGRSTSSASSAQAKRWSVSTRN
jgi:hypothetical protein